MPRKETTTELDRFKTPVALFNFNRPHLTRRLFELVRQVRPRRLLLVADGPRPDRPDDARLCAEVRAVFNEIDWECEVSRNFADANMGSFKRNSSGLTWVFDTVEEAIILEDDCIPSPSFFPYCEELLERYRDDPRIGVISGNNFVQPRGARGNDSYSFSVYALTWGWASWRRVWKEVDLGMSWWEPEAGKVLLRRLFPRRAEYEYWRGIYQGIHEGTRRNAWDYQIILSLLRHSRLCAVPDVNLISNIGHGSGATNCTDPSSPLANVPSGELTFPLRHPDAVMPRGRMDRAIFLARFDCYGSTFLFRRWTLSAAIAMGSLLPFVWKERIRSWMRNLSTFAVQKGK